MMNKTLFFPLLVCMFLRVPFSMGQTLFSEEALTRGISATTDPMFYGSGVSFYDWDKDGWPDISYCVTGEAPRFFHNEQGNFVEVQFNIPNVNGEAKQLLWVDYDNDGDADLFLTRSFGPWSLYQNNGNFLFSNVTSSVGMFQAPGPFPPHTIGAACADINRDGFLDFYICNYHGPDSVITNLMFLNNAGTSFTEIAESAGIDDGYKVSFMPAFFDADMDGWPDLHVINDRYPYPNTFYRNNGDLTFTDETETSGLGIYIDAMSNSPGDYDNDGDLDMYETNSVASTPVNPGGNFLFNNDGEGNFTIVSEETDTAVKVWIFSWGAQWIDQDSDGYLDLFVATSGNDDLAPIFSNHFASNNTDGTFQYQADSGFESSIGRTYAVAAADFDNDGASDLALSCKAPYRNELWRNNSTGHTYIKLSLEGTVSNRDAVGASVYCYTNGMQQLRHTMCGEAYLAQNSQYILFGLNGAATVDSLVVRWPSGMVEKVYDVPANQTIHLVEGSMPVGVEIWRSPENCPIRLHHNTVFVLRELNALRVVNQLGQEVIVLTRLPDQRSVELGHLDSGIYFIQWTDANGTVGTVPFSKTR